VGTLAVIALIGLLTALLVRMLADVSRAAAAAQAKDDPS
jgi:type II secretory pathway pseudopilin PulG